MHALSTIADVTVTLRKLSTEETARAFARRGQTDVLEYVTALRALQAGDSAEIALDGLSSRAAKRRLGIAAAQVGYRLKWASARADDRLYFRVLLATAGAARAKNGRRTRPPVVPPEAPISETSNQPVVSSSSAPARARRRRVARTS